MSDLVSIRKRATLAYVGWVSEAQPTVARPAALVGCASLTHPTMSIEGFPDSHLGQLAWVAGVECPRGSASASSHSQSSGVASLHHSHPEDPDCPQGEPNMELGPVDAAG